MAFPQSSVAVHVLVITLSPSHGLVSLSEEPIVTEDVQLSVAVAVPVELVVTSAKHCASAYNVVSDGHVIIGAKVSRTVMV